MSATIFQRLALARPAMTRTAPAAIAPFRVRRALHTAPPNAARAREAEQPNGHNVASVLPSAGQLRMLLIGAPGAGKGTQSARLQRDYGFAALSSGDLLRRHVAQNTPVGRQAADFMSRGELVPDSLMIRLLVTELASMQEEQDSAGAVPNGAGWLLDGFPRNRVQAESLDKTLAAGESPLNLVVSLNVPDEVILERILSRWVHAPSGRVYNLGYNPPLRSGLDDVTGEPLTQRPDDNADVFRARMRAFRETTEPLLEHYERQGVLVKLHGETSDVIYDQLRQVLAEWEPTDLAAPTVSAPVMDPALSHMHASTSFSG